MTLEHSKKDIEAILETRVIMIEFDRTREQEDEICLEYAIQTGGLIVTNDKFRNREDFVRSAHDRFNYANQDMTMCRKRIIEHFFTGPSSIELMPRDSKTIEKISSEILSNLQTHTPRIEELFYQNRPYLRD